MLEHYQSLISQYKDIETFSEKSQTKIIIFEILIVLIVCGMKSIQTTASITLNMIASTCVSVILLWHFWGFKQRRSLDSKKANMVLEGIQIERQNQFSNLSFFQNYLKKFNILGEIIKNAIFDFTFLYFFSVSITQLLQCIKPEIIEQMMPSTLVRTLIISALLVWAYYMPLRPITYLKKELLGSWI